MDRLQELLARYNDENTQEPLNGDELQELHDLLVARSEEIGENTSDEAIAELREIADTADRVRAEQATRAEQEQERATTAAELRDRIRGEADQGEDGTEGGDGTEGTGDGGEGTEDGTPAEGGGSGTEDGGDGTDATPAEATPAQPEGGAPQPEAGTEQEPEAIAASTPPARPTPGMIGRTRTHRTVRRTDEGARVSITAAGDVAGFSAGQTMDAEQLGEAFAAKANAIMRSKMPVKALVASIESLYPEDRQLDREDEETNRERIEAVTDPSHFVSADQLPAHVRENSIVAAGGICAPVEASYELQGISDDRRPIRDSLARFNARRGGIRFVTPPRLADFAPGADLDDAVGVEWTHARDVSAATDDNIRKTCVRIDCGEPIQVLLDAVYKCLTVGNFARRTFPEQFARFWQLAGAQLSREAEDKMWDAMVAASTPVSVGQGLGASRDLLAGLDRITAGFRSRHRTPDRFPLHFWAPDWLRDLIRSDLVRGIESTDAFAVADATIGGFFTARNINVTWSPDATQEFGPEGGGGVDPWPSQVETILTHEGAFLHLDGGTLDFGTEIRDVDKIRANDVDAFMELFENVAFQGVESLAPTFDLCPDGSRAALKSYNPCTSGS